MGTDALRKTDRLKWEVPKNLDILSKTIDVPGSPDPVLQLACFVKPPRICFDNVKIGVTKVKVLKIFNPGEEVESVVLEKFPDPELGFAIEGLHPDQQLYLQPGEEVEVKILWQPVRPGNARHLVTFRWIGGQKLQLVLLSSACDPNTGKKKRARQIPTKRVLHPSHRLNIQQGKVHTKAKNELLIQEQRRRGYESPNVKHLVDIAPDTPSRRSTFTVAQPALDKKDRSGVCSDEKENISITANNQVNRATFSVEKPASQAVIADEETQNADAKSLRFGATSFEGKISDGNGDDDQSMTGSTFHESEIRLSSSPIKWCIGYERLTSSTYKRELHPGQVVLNGKVKHEFIPYPSFDNTDTFLNMEMSTAGKHRVVHEDESLTFDSAASSLFTITREEKFYPNLEPVRESDDVLATPKACSSESKTLTNETDTGTPMPNENGTWINEVRESKDFSFAVAREEKFFPNLEPLKEASCVVETPKACQSRTLTNETYAATPLPTDKRIWGGDAVGDCVVPLKFPDETDEIVCNNEMNGPSANGRLHDFASKSSHTCNIENRDNTASPDESLNSKEEAQAEGGQSSSEQATSAIDEMPHQLVVVDNSNKELVNKDATASKQVVDTNLIDGGEQVGRVKDHGKIFPIASILEDNAQKSSFASRSTSKKAIPTLKSSGIKEPKGIKKTEKLKVVQSKYMNNNLKGEMPCSKQNKVSMKPQPKKEKNVIDAKFKGISLPQKRRNETAISTGKSGVPTVAIKKLKLIKPQEKIARHPMPFAAKNMFYDERWIEKQERGFKNWLNFVLTPPDDNVETRSDVIRGTVCLESDSNQPVAPTKEMLSFRMYAAKRRMAKLRRDACMLYQTDQFASVIHKIEREIEHGRLAIRVDRHVDADLGVRKHIADLLLSFNPLWLRIGLEVVYGEIIPVNSNNDASGLSRFIHRRLLGNPDIAAEYSHPSVPGLFKPGYVEALGKFTLKKLLLVIIYLDNAKHSRLISHDPCLFNKDSQFKSIREMLLMFSRDYLHREGDIVKHLTYLGYTVSHVQTALHEYDFGVSSLAVDLRDGLRLVRVVELLTHNWSLSSKLRVPAVSRLQKIHNVELAFQGLKERNLDVRKESNIDARLIVDGHREKTLSLLWKIIFHFQVDLLLDEEKLKDEIKYLERKNQLMKDYNEFRQNAPLKIAEDDLFENCSYSKSEKLGLLLHWCHLVGKLHGVQIENFTVSFSDGRALCYLLNHYHPSLLTKEEIRDETTSTCLTSQEESGDEIDSYLVYQHSKSKLYPSRTGENIILETLLGNEKHNLNIFCEKVKEIGASPAMVLASDMSNTIPDEKVTITYLSFLCSRLLDLREEIRAARCIQLAWRQRHLHVKQKEHQNLVKATTKIQAITRGFLTRRRLQKKIDAVKILQRNVRIFLSKRRQSLREYSATVIQQYCRGFKQSCIARESFLTKRAAAVKIQKAYRDFSQVRNAYQQTAASCIQAAWKRYQVFKVRRKENEAALIVQKNWKRYICRKRFLVARNAAMVLQSNLRAYFKKLSAREAFLRMKRAALTIQICWRKVVVRREKVKLEACIVIQACFRRYQCRLSYLEMKRAAIIIQSYVRKHRCQSQYNKLKRTVVYLQSTRRSLAASRNVRQTFLRRRDACTTIQRMYRGRIARRDFKRIRTSAVKLQTAWRSKVCRQEFMSMRLAASKIQCAFRSWKIMYVERKRFIKMKGKIIMIQAAFRGHIQRKRFLTVRNTIIKLQALLRGKVCRERFLSLQDASVTIQRHYRAVVLGRIAQRDYQQERESAIKIQAWYRGKKARKLYVDKRNAAICFQSSYRRLVAERRFGQLKVAATVIQQRFRAVKLCQATQVHYLITKAAAIKIQSVYKGYLVRKDISNQHNAAVLIQATFRGYSVRMSIRRKMTAASKIQSLCRRYLAMKEYRAIRGAVVKIQRFYRGYLQMKTVANRFNQARAAVVKIQAVSRGFLCRKLLQRHRAARKLQAITRGYLQRKRYLKVLVVVSKVQAMVRHKIERRRRDDAALFIQRHWKALKHGRALRARFVHDRQACIKIQAFVRRWIKMRCYARFRSAALVFQRRFKAQSLMKEKKREYQHMRRSAIVIQSAYRMHLARKQFIDKKKASLVLQRQMRVFLAKRRFHREMQAAAIIQIWYKACREMKKRRIMFSKQKKAAVLLQTQQRGLILRRNFALMKSAIIKIQAWYRMLTARRRYVEVKNGVLVLQRRYRAFAEARLQQLYFHLLRGAVITIQACVRGFLARCSFLRKRKAAVCLQTSWRRCVCEKGYRSLRMSVVKMQRNVRANALARFERRGFLQKRAAAVMLQRKMREYLIVKKAVIIVQSQFRMLRDRRRFVMARDNCIKIQICFRRFAKRKVAATLLQSSWRMYVARKSYLCMITACIKIQSIVRGFIVKRRYMLCLGAALAIQRRYRALVEGTSVRLEFLHMRSSCVLLQACVRGWLARKNFINLRTKSIIIQQCFRAHVAMKNERSHFIELRSATLTIQAAYRGYAAKVLVKCMREQKRVEEALKLAKEQQILLERQEAATVIQKHFKRLQVRSSYVTMRENAIKIQQWYRSHLLTLKMRNEFLVKCESVLVIQRAYRMHVAKRYLDMLKRRRERLNTAATCIQSMFRCSTERRMFLKKKNAVKAIQVCFKRHLLAKTVRSQYLLKRSSAIAIQAAYRSYAAKRLVLSLQKRRNLELNAAILIQKQTRGLICRRGYRRLRNAVVLIQCTYRSTRQMIEVRDGYKEMRNATLKIQHTYRAYLIRKAINKRIIEKNRRIEGAMTIQASYRRYKLISSLRTVLRLRRAATLKIQRCFRDYLARKQLLKFRAALKIQRAYRQYKIEQNTIRESAAIKIQATFRGFIQRKQYQKLRAFTVILQRKVRKSLQQKQSARKSVAAVFIQSWYRSIRSLRRDMTLYKKKKEAALCIQSVWRGYLVRRSIVDRKTIRARERIKSANMEATEPKKLCNRTKSALSYLLSCRYVSTIYDALKDLEVSTRLTKKCCERLVLDGGLPVIFQIIRNCNRSLPSIEQIHMALLVLTNVAKCETTYMAVIEEKDSLQLLIELMANFRDKRKIFPSCCILLSTLCKDYAIVQMIQRSNILSKKLSALNSLICRKAEIELKRTNGKLNLKKDERKDLLPVIEQMSSITHLVATLSPR